MAVSRLLCYTIWAHKLAGPVEHPGPSRPNVATGGTAATPTRIDIGVVIGMLAFRKKSDFNRLLDK